MPAVYNKALEENSTSMHVVEGEFLSEGFGEEEEGDEEKEEGESSMTRDRVARHTAVMSLAKTLTGKMKNFSSEICSIIQRCCQHSTAEKALWFSGRKEPLVILWIGLKTVEQVIHLYYSLLGLQPDLKIHIHVVEDIADIRLPQRYQQLESNIFIHAVDFMFFDSTQLFDIMFISVEATLSRTLKLCFFAFGAHHFRKHQPLIMVGHHDVFDMDTIDVKPKKILKQRVMETIVKGEYWSSLVTFGEDLFGELLVTPSFGKTLMTETSRSLNDERMRTFSTRPSCSAFFKLLSAGSDASTRSKGRLAQQHAVLDITIFTRLVQIRLSTKFKNCVERLLAEENVPEHVFEISQALYYQVRVIINGVTDRQAD
jgi:hypothetical protein